MLVSAGYGVCRGAYGLYRGARSLAAVETLSVEAATMECRSMSCLADNIICTENSLLAEQIGLVRLPREIFAHGMRTFCTFLSAEC